MGRFQFLKEKKFYLHLAIVILSFFIFLWIIFRILGSYTRHDKTYVMPDFIGQNINEVKRAHSKVPLDGTVTEAAEAEPRVLPGLEGGN